MQLLVSDDRLKQIIEQDILVSSRQLQELDALLSQVDMPVQEMRT